MTLRYRLAAFLSLVALGLGIGLHAAGVAPTNVLNTAADLAGKTLVTAEGNRTITGTFSFNVPVRLNPGTTSAPGVVSTSDQTTGWQLSVGAIGGSISGTQKLLFNTTAFALSVPLTLTTPLGVGYGGTGLATGTSGGLLYFSGASTIASSGALTQYGVMLGGGAGAAPTAITPLTTGQQLYGVTGASPVAATPASSHSTPTDKTGNSTTALLMNGLACAITPVATGRVIFAVMGTAQNDSGAASAQIQLAYGTGAAPANAAAATGTVISAQQSYTVTSGANSGFVFTIPVTGLTLNTAYWFDLQIKETGGNTAHVNKVDCSAWEF